VIAGMWRRGGELFFGRSAVAAIRQELGGRGMKRCLAEGRERFELLIGAAVLANNLMRIGSLLTKRSSRKRRSA
jgi:hypothetical protein